MSFLAWKQPNKSRNSLTSWVSTRVSPPRSTVGQEHNGWQYFEQRTPQHCRNIVARLVDLQELSVATHQSDVLRVVAHTTILRNLAAVRNRGPGSHARRPRQREAPEQLRPLLAGATVVTQILVMFFIFQRFLGVPTTTARDRFIEGVATPDIQ